MSQISQNQTCPIPTLHSERLTLRAFSMDDCPIVAELAGHPDIAKTTLVIPHPYALSDAQNWIATHQKDFAEGQSASFAITLRESRELIGAISLRFEPAHRRAELGFWVGKPYWNRGYASEAGRAVVKWGFDHQPLQRIYAYHLAMNPASGRVQQKIGMRYEGTLREHIVKDGVACDCLWYGILRSDLDA